MNNDLERVAIVASAQTQLRSAWGSMQHVDLIGATVKDLLNGSGFRIEDIDVIIDCGSDVLDGRSISNCGFLGAMGAHHKEESRVEEDGIFVWILIGCISNIAVVRRVLMLDRPHGTTVI